MSSPFQRVLELVRFLRARCPWDAAQTPRSLTPYLLEEAHEVIDAVEDRDDAHLAAELGDLLLHVAFQVVLAEERGAFGAEEVVSAVEAKMRRRHPHLYDEGEREGWERLKARERAGRSLVEGLARGLDPLSRAHRIQDRVSAVGFDWAEPAGALAKVREELEEVARALHAAGDTRRTELDPPDRPAPDAAAVAHLEEELGDLLFAAVNLARLTGIHPLHALGAANRKFTERFKKLEALAAERGIAIENAGLEVLDGLWDEVKRA